MGALSVKISKAELPLNPKEMELKRGIDEIDYKVKEMNGKIREECSSLWKEKKAEKEAFSKIIRKFEESSSSNLDLKLKKWYIKIPSKLIV